MHGGSSQGGSKTPPCARELYGTPPASSFLTPSRLTPCTSPSPSYSLAIDMNTFKKPVLALILVAFGAILGGCTSKTAKDTSIPWSRPADWEGQMPGMGSGR